MYLDKMWSATRTSTSTSKTAYLSRNKAQIKVENDVCKKQRQDEHDEGETERKNSFYLGFRTRWKC
ncbi:unnamed protein product [Amoebophrya sp. A25]|nr:unnamed protein product [Amoebophrya sp. A25]|eukprot:GSA25T00004506001.1